jgi:hypothetical protein
MVNSPMDVDMEAERNSLPHRPRRSCVTSRVNSTVVSPKQAHSPKGMAQEDAQTQTRRIFKARRNGEAPDDPLSPPDESRSKRKLFHTPAKSPLSPSMFGGRVKMRRIEESLGRADPPTVRKSRTRNSSARVPRTSSSATDAYTALTAMTVRQLKNMLVSAGFDPSGCIEKSELVEKAKRLGLGKQSRNSGSGQPPSTKPTPYMQPVVPPQDPPPARKRHSSRKHSGGRVSPAAIAEIARIEEVCSRVGSTCFDILGMSRLGATDIAVRSRSKQLFRHVHPDKIHDDTGDIKRRAHNVFQSINQAVDEAMRILSSAKSPPKPPSGLTYTIERSGTVLVLRWRPEPNTESFRVTAGVIDQGSVANLTSDTGELEYAISTHSRSGNDELFRRGRFEVSVVAVNVAGESQRVSVLVDVMNNAGGGLLKRHHTIC